MTKYPHHRYLGDGVHATVTFDNKIKLRASKPGHVNNIYLEPEVLIELAKFAREIGWGNLLLPDAKYVREQQRGSAPTARRNWTVTEEP